MPWTRRTYGPDALMLYVYSVADFEAVDRVAVMCAVMDEFPELTGPPGDI